jgi:hypothetical protein
MKVVYNLGESLFEEVKVMSDQKEQQKQWAKIVAKAWADEDYKQRLMEDPAAVLSEEGMPVPEGVDIKVVEATDKQAWMVLPPKPEDGKIEERADLLAASVCFCSSACYFDWGF